MSRRPHVVPSQRIPLSVSTAHPAVPPRRSAWWIVGVTLAGWALLGYPAALLALVSVLMLTGTPADPNTAGTVAAGLLGLVFVAVMAATPVVTGFAVARRRRGLWVGAVAGWALSVAAVIYVIVEWIIPLA